MKMKTRRSLGNGHWTASLGRGVHIEARAIGDTEWRFSLTPCVVVPENVPRRDTTIPDEPTAEARDADEASD